MWKVFRIIQSNINSLEIFWQVWLKFSFWMGLFYLLNSSSKFTWLRFLGLSKSTNSVILPFYNPDFVCFWLFRRNIMLLVNKIAYRTFERNLSLKTNLVLKNTYSANLEPDMIVWLVFTLLPLRIKVPSQKTALVEPKPI